MGVDFERCSNIRMTHEILQFLDGNPGSGKLRAEGVPQNMRCDDKLIDMRRIIVIDDPLQCVLKMTCHLGLLILVQKQKAAFPFHHDFNLRLRAIPQDPLKCLIYFIAHGDKPIAALGFRLFQIILARSGKFCAYQLPFDVNPSVGKIQI